MDLIINPSNYALNVWGIPVSVVGILILCLALYVWLRRPTAGPHIAFFFFAFTLGQFLAIYGWIFQVTNPDLAFLLHKIMWVGIIFISPSIYASAVTILELPDQRKRITLAYLLFVPFLIAHPFDLIISGVTKFPWAYDTLNGPIFVPFLVAFLAQMVLILSFYIRAFRNPKLSSIKHQQAKLLLIGISIAYIASVDFISNFGIPWQPTAFIWLGTWASIVAYAILKFELFKVTPQIAAPTIISTMGDALLVADTEGKIVIANRAASQLLHQTDDAKMLLGKPLESYLPESSSLWKRVLSEPKSTVELFSQSDTDLVAANGKTIPVSLSIGIVRDASGAALGLTAVAHDMTDTQKLIRQLKKQKRDLESVNKRLGDQAQELANRTEEAERLNKLAVGRELKMIELKKQIEGFGGKVD